MRKYLLLNATTTIKIIVNYSEVRALLQKSSNGAISPNQRWSGGGFVPQERLDRNAKINAEVYQNKILRDVLHSWAIENFGENRFFLQQDWAPAHAAKTTIQVCEELFLGFWGKDVWPSNSPDFNAMDFSVWSILEQELNKRFKIGRAHV